MSELLGQLGAAGAIVIVVGYFLNYLKEQGKIIGELRESNIRMQEEYRSSIEMLANKFIKGQEELQDFFQKQLTIITSAQNEILRETVIIVKTLEKTMKSIKDDISSFINKKE